MKSTRLAAVPIALALAGCAATSDLPPAAPTVAPSWQAPLPHDGDVGELRRWWTQFDDPLLARLIDAAEGASPTIASAAARIADARARRAAAGAALLPGIDANANIGRGRQDVSLPSGTSESVGLQASWELDVFGRNRAARDAAEARVVGAAASWHDARVVVAAETANQYVGLRACEALLAQARLDAASRGETARLTELSMQSGFESRANAALTRASAAQALVTVKQQGEQCEQAVKALVALTGIAEPTLRADLAAAAARLPMPAAIAVPAVPAEALAQRPDVFARARDVVAASADVGAARAALWPRITLAGSIGAGRFEYGAGAVSGTTWSIGPLAVSLPVFDAGAAAPTSRRRARATTRRRARTRRRCATPSATSRTRSSRCKAPPIGTPTRRPQPRTSRCPTAPPRRATKSGFGTLFELEDARRTALAAQNALIDVRRERVAAWIALYRALGGGWSPLAGERSAANSSALSPSP